MILYSFSDQKCMDLNNLNEDDHLHQSFIEGNLQKNCKYNLHSSYSFSLLF